MNRGMTTVVVGCLACTIASYAGAQDWPQWRGVNRDARAVGFNPPATWPKELTRKWKVAVGDGVATPALVGDKLYVFSRQGGSEIIRCLDAGTGQEIWQDKYAAEAVGGPASGFGGPRSSPIVAEGKVVTLGVQGTLSCLNAATGALVWRSNEYEGSVPRFATASSPLVVAGLCIAHLGGDRDGAIVAFDISTGNEKWKWVGDSPAYGSPVLMTVSGTQVVIAPTDKNMVALRAADGKLLWQIPYSQGRYNAATPIVDGQMVVYAGPTRGTTAEKIVQKGEELTAEDLWTNPDNSLQFSTPVLKDGLIFGVSNMNNLFCVNAETGQTAWSTPIGATAAQPEAGRQRGPGRRDQGAEGRRGRRGRRGGRGGYGSIVDAGSILLALTPASELIVFRPSDQAYTEVAKYKVADGPTHAYPVAAGNRIFVKDSDSVTLWTVD